jgi:Domain of unknown function (DUF1883)
MEFLHRQVVLGSRSRLVVDLEDPASVRLIAASDLSRFRAGRRVMSWGASFTAGRVVLAAPHAGRFELILDRGRRGGRLGYVVRVEG